MKAEFDAVVIGGGFYGLRISLHLRELGLRSVAVLERGDQFMGRSSYVNQARVHNGYHYPRSILTAYRSRVNFPDFRAEFADAVVDDFTHLYAIASRLSKVSARQFELFCSRIGAVCEPWDDEAGLFNPASVDGVFRVTEPAFDSRILRGILLDRIAEVGGIELRTGVEVESVGAAPAGGIVVRTDAGELTAPRVISAVYSQLNELHRRSGLEPIGLQHELTEMALVELPAAIGRIALTVMDGPFFSMMPFPSRGLHTLSHVRYTPHHRWRDLPGSPALDPYSLLDEVDEDSAFRAMRADVARFVPALAGLVQHDSIREVKTVLTKSDTDDSRPILFRPDHGIPGYTCIMGGKLDNIYDVLQELTALYV